MEKKLRGVLVTFTRDKAECLKPILRWVRDEAPRKEERLNAKIFLRELSGTIPEGEWKQILITKKQKRFLDNLYAAFPGGAAPDSGKQLELFGGSFTETKHPRVGPPDSRYILRNQIKKELTKEDMDARESLNLPRLGKGQRAAE